MYSSRVDLLSGEFTLLRPCAVGGFSSCAISLFLRLFCNAFKKHILKLATVFDRFCLDLLMDWCFIWVCCTLFAPVANGQLILRGPSRYALPVAFPSARQCVMWRALWVSGRVCHCVISITALKALLHLLQEGAVAWQSLTQFFTAICDLAVPTPSNAWAPPLVRLWKSTLSDFYFAHFALLCDIL